MNNLKTTDNGGFPIVLDDFRFLSEAFKEALKGVLSPFGVLATDCIVLSGVERSIVSTNVEYTEGFVFFGGEVYHVAAQSYPIPVSGESEYFVINVTYDPAGTKVFENAASNDTYEVRKVKIEKHTSAPAGGILLANKKNYYDLISSGADTERIGVVKDFAGAVGSIPAGYLLCDGSAVSRTTYANLYAVIGDTWGNGDGSTTFNLPPAGKFVVGFDGSDADYDAVGKTGGEKEHTLTEDELPAHTHALDTPKQVSDTDRGTGNSSGWSLDASDITEYNTSSVGGNQAHENRPPYAVFAKIIKY